MVNGSCYYGNRPYLIVFGCFLIHLSIGYFYTFGNIQGDIVNYMKNNSLSGNSVDSKSVLSIVGLLVFGLGSAVTAGGFLSKEISSALTVLIGGWIMSINVILAYFTIKSYLSILAISYGLFAGIGTGLAYGVALEVPLKYFPNHKGLIIGIIMAGFALSSVIFDKIQNLVLNNDRQNNLELLPNSFVVLGCSYAILQVFGSILIQFGNDINRSKESDLDDQNRPELFNGESRALCTGTGLKPHEIIFELDFWILWLTILLNFSNVPIFASFYQEFGKNILLKDFPKNEISKHLMLVNIIAGICNASGRIFWGSLTDRKPYKVVMITLSLANSVFMGSFNFLKFIEDSHTCLYIFGLFVGIINFLQAGFLSVFPTTCEKLFGLPNFVCNYGLLFTSTSVSGIIVTAIAVSFGSQLTFFTFYLKLFSIGGVMSIVAAGLTLLFRGKSLMVSRY